MITELFALPIGLQTVAKFEDEEFFSSNSLKEKLIIVVKESSILKPIEKEVITLINDNRIIPIFSNSEIISYLKKKLFPPDNDKFFKSMGFCDHDKIYILIDNNSNLIGFAKDNFLARLLLHELMHMVASLNPNYFLVTFKPQLTIFYKDLFTRLFKLKDSKKIDLIVEDFYKKLFYSNEAADPKLDMHRIVFSFNLLKKYSLLKKEEFEKVSMDYVKIVVYHLTDQHANVFTPNNKYILREPYHVYKDKFGFFPITKNCVQELFVPSEVICSITEYKQTPETYKAIKKLV